MQVLTHFPLLKALGWALFNSLWQMAALWLLYVLIVAFFQNAAIRHRFALLLLGAGAVWTGVSFVAALLFPGNDGSFVLSLLPSNRTATAGVWQGARGLVEEALPYGSALYLLILAGSLIRHCASYRHSKRLTKLGLSAMPPQFRTFVRSTALQLGIRMPVKAWLSSLIDVPLTLGFLKPVILLPAAMITHLTPQQVEAILVHELAHIQRRDYLLHLLVTVLEGLFFFNPFARLLIRQLKKERENCCDDLVLQFKYDAHAYVSALLSLASRHQPLHRLAVAATGTGDRLLLQRAKRILLQQNGDRLRPGARPLFMLIFTVLVAALTVSHPLLQPRKTAPVSPTRLSRVYYIRPGAVALTRRPATPPTATAPRSSEIAFNRPIIVTFAPKAGPRTVARARTHSRHTPSPSGMTRFDFIPDGGEDLIVNTADDGFAFGNSDGTPSSPETTGEPVANSAPDPDTRDFSMNIPQVAGPVGAIQYGTPFIPNSSFSFQYTVTDSSNPEERLFYLQQTAQLEVLTAIAKLQQQTASRLKTLNDQLSQASESVRLRKEIRNRQMQLQQDYFRKIMSWQNKLQKNTHFKMIVYI